MLDTVDTVGQNKPLCAGYGKAVIAGFFLSWGSESCLRVNCQLIASAKH